LLFYQTQVPPHYIAHINNAAGGLHASLPSYGVGSSSNSNNATATGSGTGTPTGTGSGPADKKKSSRKIGTQDRPLETGYYDILGVAIDATTDDIKKAYRRLAIKHHPDKNPDDPTASARFTQIGIAYQTLSDPDLRKKYNEFGAKESQPEGGFVDPEEVFGAIFGGERFVPIIGHIGLASDMKAAMQEEAEEDDDDKEDDGKKIEGKDGPKKKELSPEERRRREEKRRVKEEKERQRSAEVRIKL
jgi:hypothetical protein